MTGPFKIASRKHWNSEDGWEKPYRHWLSWLTYKVSFNSTMKGLRKDGEFTKCIVLKDLVWKLANRRVVRGGSLRVEWQVQNSRAAEFHVVKHSTSSRFKLDNILRRWWESHLHFIVCSLLRKKENGVWTPLLSFSECSRNSKILPKRKMNTSTVSVFDIAENLVTSGHCCQSVTWSSDACSSFTQLHRKFLPQ